MNDPSGQKKRGNDEPIILAKEYVELLPVLLAVLRRLASTGYFTSMGQAMDHVHDFFADDWPQARMRFVPSKGTLAAFAAGAFLRFVRPRLVREAKWTRSLVEIPDDFAPELAASDNSAKSIDMVRIREATRRLPEADRALLMERFGSRFSSERDLARQQGITRYKLRLGVAGALARLAASLGEPGSLNSFEFTIMRKLFLENSSIEATAADLSCSEAQVRAARRRVLNALSRH